MVRTYFLNLLVLLGKKIEGVGRKSKDPSYCGYKKMGSPINHIGWLRV